MLARNFRSIWNQKVQVLGKFSTRLGLSADFWTVVGLIFAIIGGFTLAFQQYFLSLVFSVAMLACDVMDGATAREQKFLSKFGIVFDHSVDRYAELFLFSGLIISGAIHPGIGLFALSGGLMASYVRSKAESAGGVEDCTVGIAGRVEKLALFFLGIIFLMLDYQTVAGIMIALIGLISHITAIQRLVYARRVIRTVEQRDEL